MKKHRQGGALPILLVLVTSMVAPASIEAQGSSNVDSGAGGAAVTNADDRSHRCAAPEITVEIGSRLPLGEAASVGGATIVREVASQCAYECFGHTCSIDCGEGKRASCGCIQVKRKPSGWQWLPRCYCASTAASDDPSDRAAERPPEKQ